MPLEKHQAAPIRRNRGAVQCWCSPAGGWSYVQTIGERTVTVIDTWAGGHPVTRAVLPDKVKATMTPAEVTAARKTGVVQDTSDGTGFHLTQAP